MANVTTGWGLPIAMAALWAGVGCDAQAGTGYTGEVVFSLQGNVELDPDSKLVPAIAFESGTKSSDGPEALEVVDGDLSGVFPSKFRLNVTRPPPDAAISPFFSGVLGGKGGLAYGVIVMLPPNHPSHIPRASVEEILTPEGFPVCTPDGCALPQPPEVVAKTFTNCSSDGRCRVRKTSCTQSDCELYASAGTPPEPASGLDVKTITGGPCAPDFRYCYDASTSCTLAGCYEDFYECDLTRLGPYDRAQGSRATQCQLVEDSGEDSLIATLDLSSAATEYAIMFSTEDIPNSPVGDVKRGYNLVTIPFLTREEWIAVRSCEDDAYVQARLQYNAAHGTTYALNDILPSGGATEEEKTLQQLVKACPSLPIGQVLENRPITIKVGRPQFPM
jgi:hypothetical protein